MELFGEKGLARQLRLTDARRLCEPEIRKKRIRAEE